MDAQSFLAALVYEDASKEVLQQTGISTSEGLLNRLIPRLTKLIPTISVDSNDYVLASNSISDTLKSADCNTPNGTIAEQIVWYCTIVLPAMQNQPKYLWMRRFLVQTLKKSGLSHFMQVPTAQTHSNSMLVTSMVAPAPGGGNVVLFARSFGFLYDYMWIHCRHFHEVQRWIELKVSPRVITMWDTYCFLDQCEWLLMPGWTRSAFAIQQFDAPPDLDVVLGRDDFVAIDQNTDAVMTFILLHEFGHIQLGHTDVIRQTNRLPPSADLHDWELAADAFAVKTIEQGDGYDASRLAPVCELFAAHARAEILAQRPFDRPDQPSPSSEASMIFEGFCGVESQLAGLRGRFERRGLM